ncbi:hypothetical protein NKH18_30945 [Streptomyces sp. M10(2022)]
MTAGRPDEALGIFRAIGIHATTYPWTYLGDAHTEFLEARSGIRVDLAARIPFFSRPPQPPDPHPDPVWSQLGPAHSPSCPPGRPRSPRPP